MDLIFFNKEIPTQTIYLRHFPKLLKETLVFRARQVAGSVLLRLKTATICFKLTIFKK